MKLFSTTQAALLLSCCGLMACDLDPPCDCSTVEVAPKTPESEAGVCSLSAESMEGRAGQARALFSKSLAPRREVPGGMVFVLPQSLAPEALGLVLSERQCCGAEITATLEVHENETVTLELRGPSSFLMLVRKTLG